MRVDFSKAEKAKDYEPIPSGTYEMKVTAVEEKAGDKGTYWELTLEVQGGEYDGKEVKDRLFFTPKALSRVKLVYSHLAGVDLADSESDIETDDLLGCKGMVAVGVEEREHNGKVYRNNVVPFAGYLKDQGSASLGKPKAKAKKKEPEPFNDPDEIPF